MTERKTVLVLGSFAPSLVKFRGPFISAMIAEGHRVVAAAPRVDDTTSAALAAMGAEVRDVPLRNASINPLQLVGSLSAVRALVREVQPDVLVGYTIKPVILGSLAASLERVPRIAALITGVGYAFTGGRELKRLVSRIAATFLYRTALAKCDTIIFQNRDDEALFRRLRLVGNRRDTHVVNGSGVDLDWYKPAPLPNGAVFLMIARLLKDKGIREFAEAAAGVKEQFPEAKIILVGGFDPGPDSLTPGELEELVKAGIDYRGPLDDVRPALAECSVYVLPSYREGTPRSVLEAMAMGRAVITTDAPGCRETVIEGENGFLVPPRDSGSLLSAMVRFIREPALAARMGKTSLQIARDKYDVRKVNREMLRILGLSSPAPRP